KLYAARRVRRGHAFGGADSHFEAFEEGFPFEETVDQRKAIEDVLNDMQQSVPMDRLVCGDVGYGKTEVALRAAFMAVSEAKQAALLVPTTVLAEQHYATFRERFQRYPVKVACLSRFRPAREQHDIIAGLSQGTIDIVIGTHRLLQKDVVFRDLGLLVLDEEQRFGVRHKEKIKRMRETVDVLTLTATPIPRTLHLSLLGIRDISVIATPPEERRPIVTFISEYDDVVVTEAITKELDRGGQVFFVHNHVQSIERMASRLGELVPRARLAVAHGQMPEDGLERVMLDFVKKEIDLLVCTTIIESGLDVASANTIIINRADHFGLAQIYQLRGRVGRADEQAYAYLFIPDESILTKDAQKRLKVLMEYSDLGSGFQIAMSDLKIRGGGSILGASQSGHIAAVGYDMFLKLMEESMAELKGEPIQEALEPEVNLPVSAFLSENYITDIDQRLSFYRRLARMSDLKQISTLKAELEDRYGPLPDEAGNLLLKIMLKVLAVKAGCKRLDLVARQLHLHFSEIHQRKPFGLIDLVTAEKERYRFTPDHVLIAALSPGTPKVLLSQAKNILIQIARHVNQ
ncbi:MAG: DEAD/DEAH box helicase, partial [Desulfosarcinaceae bacterium]